MHYALERLQLAACTNCTHIRIECHRRFQFPLNLECKAILKSVLCSGNKVDNLTSKRNTVNNHVILGFAALQSLYDK